MLWVRAHGGESHMHGCRRDVKGARGGMAESAARSRQEDDALREKEVAVQADSHPEEETPPKTFSHAPSPSLDATPKPLDGR